MCFAFQSLNVWQFVLSNQSFYNDIRNVNVKMFVHATVNSRWNKQLYIILVEKVC
jgi:hypothetical protein